MQIDGKEHIREISINGWLYAYNVLFCSEFLVASLCKRITANNSRHIGYLTCLNHPRTDGTNSHWRITVEISKEQGNLIDKKVLDELVGALISSGPVREPIWIEAGTFEPIESEAIGDLWSDD